MSFLTDLLGSSYKEGMTEDEISTALELSVGKLNDSVSHLKQQLSKVNGEASGYKKQLRDAMSQSDKDLIALKDELEALKASNAELVRNNEISAKTAKYLSLGYSEELAKSTAEAMQDGNFDTVFANQSKFMEEQKKSILADQMRQTSRPPAGDGSGALDYQAQIDKARTEGNMAMVAYYTRLSQQQASE